MKGKAIVACVGFVVVGAVTYLLKEPSCLWALILIYWIIGEVGD